MLSESNSASITSASSVQMAVGKRVNFTVTTSGQPAAAVLASRVPVWLTLTPDIGLQAGTAKLTVFGPMDGENFTFILHASNGVGPHTFQADTVHVLAISLVASANFFRSGPLPVNFTITTKGVGDRTHLGNPWRLPVGPPQRGQRKWRVHPLRPANLYGQDTPTHSGDNLGCFLHHPQVGDGHQQLSSAASAVSGLRRITVSAGTPVCPSPKQSESGVN